MLKNSARKKDVIEEIHHIIDEKSSKTFVGCKKIERSAVRGNVSRVNKVLRAENLSRTNTLIKACSIYIAGAVGRKPVQMRHGNSKEPWWKIWIKSSVTEIRRDINILEHKTKGDMKNDI